MTSGICSNETKHHNYSDLGESRQTEFHTTHYHDCLDWQETDAGSLLVPEGKMEKCLVIGISLESRVYFVSDIDAC